MQGLTQRKASASPLKGKENPFFSFPESRHFNGLRQPFYEIEKTPGPIRDEIPRSAARSPLRHRSPMMTAVRPFGKKMSEMERRALERIFHVAFATFGLVSRQSGHPRRRSRTSQKEGLRSFSAFLSERQLGARSGRRKLESPVNTRQYNDSSLTSLFDGREPWQDIVISEMKPSTQNAAPASDRRGRRKDRAHRSLRYGSSLRKAA
jgi:hypothetical protein